MAGYEEDRTRQLTGQTELRIHGVGGTAPEYLLRGTPVLVAGTQKSGFYRLKDPVGPAQERLEAYSWGGLTSGGGLLEAIRKSLWVILLPFTLINAAGWMVAAEDPKGKEQWGRKLLRVVAMFATAGFALSLAAISVDLIGLQCGANPDCADGQSWLGWLNIEWLRFVQGRPAGLMALALVVPMAALFIMWRITRSSVETSEGSTEENYPEVAADPADWRSGSGKAMEISRPGLWGSADRVLGITRIHFGAAVAAVAAAFAATIVWLGNETGDFALFSAVLAAYAVGIVLWGAVLLWKGGTPPDRPTYWLLRLGILAFLLAVLAGWLEGPTWAEAAGDVTAIDIRTRFNWSSLGVVSPLTVIIVLSGLALFAGRWRSYVWAWMTSFLGLIAGAAFLAALALWVANLLDRPENGQPLDVWPAYEASMVVVLILAVIIGMLVLYHLLRLRRQLKRKGCLERLDRDYYDDLVRRNEHEGRSFDEWRNVPNPEQSWLRTHKSWVRSLLKTVRISQLTVERSVQIGRIVVAVALIAWGWALVDMILIVFTDTSAGFASVLPAWGWAVTAGRWVALALVGAAITLIARAYRDPDARRRTAVMWDVLTFWPRWFHPISPPSYAATAVPQLRDHLADRHTGQPVVVAAHSQGAVLALATVARLRDETRDHVALLTFGSPARRLYGRFFPAYFGLPELEKARKLLTTDAGVRWRNLTRCPDPIGGVALVPETGPDPCRPCTSPPDDDVLDNLARRLSPTNPVDWLVPDPYPYWPESGDPLPDPKGHSNYDVDAPYPDAANELFELLPDPPQ